MHFRTLTYILFFCCVIPTVHGQLLDSLATHIPGLNTPSTLTFNQTPLHEVIRTIGKAHNINVFINDLPNTTVTHTFTEEPVKNIFQFFCGTFDLQLKPTGNILYFFPQEPTPSPPKVQIKMNNNLLSFDLERAPFNQVLRKITQLTGHTLIPDKSPPSILNGLVLSDSIEKALQNLCALNHLTLLKAEPKRYYILTDKTNPQQLFQPQSLEDLQINIHDSLIGLSLTNTSRQHLLTSILNKTQSPYLLLDKPEGKITLSAEGLTLEECLSLLLKGSGYTWKKEGQQYLIGKKGRAELTQNRIVRLTYCPSLQLIELLPEEVTGSIQITELNGLNSLLLSGSRQSLTTAMQLIRELDQPLPMVKIEMLVVDVNVSRLLNTGIKAGFGLSPDSTGNSLLPGLNYQVDGNTINDILAASGIPFLSNLGMLSSNFYLQIQAQESNGNVKVLTRPVISTLNGEEASFTIGETQYFKLRTDLTSNGAINPVTQITERIQEFQYNTTLTVTPYVSDGDMLTLDIHPNFTSPGTQTDPDIPPNVLTREFTSRIRLKNGETIVLGGLSRDSQSVNREGFPLLSRIPLIKWLFGSTNKNKSQSSLLIYITPTITYE